MSTIKPAEKVPSTFAGFIWEPSNEQQVVLLFGMLLALKRFGEPLCIEKCDTAFPDCVAINAVTGERIKIEFEFRSSAFREHKREWLLLKKNDPSARWMVVCWEHDLKNDSDILSGIEVVELKKFAADPALGLHPCPQTLKSRSEAAARFEWRAASLSPHPRSILAQLRRFGDDADSGFAVVWPERDDSMKFSITCQSHDGIGFGASAAGTIGIPFSKWYAVGDDVKALVIGKLNVALPHLDFTHHARKKKGYDIEVLLPDQGAVERFLQVWRDVVVDLSRRP